jgi:hypothetical protein
VNPRKTNLARPVALVRVNYRPVLSSKRASDTEKAQMIEEHFREREVEIGR